MKKPVVLTMLAAVLIWGVLTPCGAQSNFDVTVYPAKIELNGDLGTSQNFLVNVRNGGTADQHFRVYFMDYYIKANNDFVFKDPGHYSYSCAKWLSTDTTEMDVPAGAVGQKQFTLNVPPKAEPGGHFAVIFFEQATADGGQIRAKGRIGVLTLVTVPGPITRKGSIKSVQVTSSWFWSTEKLPLMPKAKVHCRVVFYNEGNVHLTVRGKLTYSPTFGWGTGSVNLGEITVLPKTTRYLEADIKDPPFLGSYKAKAEVSYGPSMDVFDTTVTKEGSFNIYPLSLVVLLLILLALIIFLILVLRRRRRKRTAKGGRGASKRKKAEEEIEREESDEPTDEEGGEEVAEDEGEPDREEPSDEEEVEKLPEPEEHEKPEEREVVEGEEERTEAEEGEERLPRRAERKKAQAKPKSRRGKHRAAKPGKHRIGSAGKNDVRNWK